MARGIAWFMSKIKGTKKKNKKNKRVFNFGFV